jgi:hypothetical protein
MGQSAADRALEILAQQATQRATLGAYNLVPLDFAVLNGVATYTSPVWTPNAYRKLIVDLDVVATAFSYIRFQANAVGALTYTDIGLNNNSAASTDPAAKGTNGFARVGINAGAGTNATMHLEFWPLTSGRTRNGLSVSMSDGNSATIGNSFGRMTQFSFNDTATDISFITLSVAAATMTGTIKLLGEPA